MASSRIRESFLLVRIFPKTPSQFSSDLLKLECVVLAEKFKPTADQLSELLFLARKIKLSRLTTFFASTATTLFSY